MKYDKVEVRAYDSEVTCIRATGAMPVIVGHAAVFDKLSENLGGFREQISQGAFDSVLKDDVRALIDHDPKMILGRLSAGNLRLSVDKVGLRYEVNPTDTSYSRDLMANLEAKNITQSSFGFVVDEDDWQEDSEGRVIRTVTKMKRLFDVSPVTFPAYPDATVSKRGFDQFMELRSASINSLLERKLKEIWLLGKI